MLEVHRTRVRKEVNNRLRSKWDGRVNARQRTKREENRRKEKEGLEGKESERETTMKIRE